MEASVQRSLSKIKSVISCRLKAVLQSKCLTAAAWKFPYVCLINTWWLAFSSAIPKVKKKKKETKQKKKKKSEEPVEFLFNYFFVGAPSKLVQLWLTAANSPQSHSFRSALSVSAHGNMKALETCVYLLLTGPLPSSPLHYGSVQSQLRLYSRTQWAIHHRWQGLLWKLAAMLPLGKKTQNISIEPKWPLALWWLDFLFFSLHLSVGTSVYRVVIEWQIYFTWRSPGQ